MNDFEDRLTRGLQQQAGAIDEIDPSARARMLVQRGHQVRRRRTALATGVAVAVVAAGGSLALVPHWGSSTPGVPAAPSSAATPSGSATPGVHVATGEPLPAPATGDASATTSSSAAPSIDPTSTTSPVHGERVGKNVYLVTPDGRFLLPALAAHQNADVTDVVVVADGWVVETSSQEFTGGGPDSGSQVLHVNRSGVITRWASVNIGGLLLSPDGASVAWVTEAANYRGRASVTTRSVATGATRTWTLPVTGNQAIFMSLTSWVDNRITATYPDDSGFQVVIDVASGAMVVETGESSSGGNPASSPASSSAAPKSTAPATTAPASQAASTSVPPSKLTNNGVVLVTSGGDLLLPEPTGSRNAGVTAGVTVADGWVVETSSQDFTGGGPDNYSQVLHVTDGGAPTARWDMVGVAGLTASPDHSKVAWLKEAQKLTDHPKVVVHDATGSGQHTLTLPWTGTVGISVRLTGWNGKGLVLTVPTGDGTTGGFTTITIDPVTGAVVK